MKYSTNGRANRVLKRFKFTCTAFVGLIALQLTTNAAVNAQYRFRGVDYQFYEKTETGKGFIEEWNDEVQFCSSFLTIPGASLLPDGLLAFAYLLTLFYLFLGISIVADIFMSAIETITSQTKMIKYQDQLGNDRVINALVWNETVANLTLMALGSSAPEILLSVIETVTTLNSEPGELGPSTIVGSAAFNLLFISGVCIIGVPSPSVKKILNVGVFATTTLFSIFAYIWLFIVLTVWTKDLITVLEAVLTLVFFLLLIIISYIFDRCYQRSQRLAGKAYRSSIQVDAQTELAKLVETKGYAYVIQAILHDDQSMEKNEREHIRQLAMASAQKDDMREITLDPELLGKLCKPPVINERMAIRRKTGKAMNAVTNFVSLKKEVDPAVANAKFTGDLPAGYTTGEPNPLVGFKCQSYKALESCGKFTIKVVKKKDGPLSIGIRTLSGTAQAGSDFEGFDHIIKFSQAETERDVIIAIIKDQTYELDEDFYVELYDPSTMTRLLGSDSIATITIIDDDKPGYIKMKSYQKVAHINDSVVKLELLRMKGSDGEIQVGYKTCLKNFFSHPATAGVHYQHVEEEVVTFMPGEASKVISIPIFVDKAKMLELNGQTKSDQVVDEHFYQFAVQLINKNPNLKMSKKSITYIELMDEDDVEFQKLLSIEKMIGHFIEEDEVTYCGQFIKAVRLSPQLDQDGLLQDISTPQALIHFLAIGWKVIFAFIPPPRIMKGWLCFGVALLFIGIVTAVVGEFANLFGCSIGLPASITAITFVALGTSLPDMFASMQAAKQSPGADSAIGNITGSNSVNVFLGLGLPWLIGSIYNVNKGNEGYYVPAGDLAFSVIIFTICCLICIFVLILRRCVVGGELGGPKGSKMASGIFLMLIWVIYVILSSLKITGKIFTDDE